ncbi:MAG: metallophosphoesterase [Gammaproteobacteria bacterium]|nr:metallophosphoesterase [Gammaproteobacteria bacterium]
MQIIKHEWFSVPRHQRFTIIPLGDIHLGARACDEKQLSRVVKRIRKSPDTYWIGLGDYADFINRSDRRFDPATLASWFTVADLVDPPRAQIEKLMEYLLPIADKCLGLIEGNHESLIRHRYERDVYSEIVSQIKRAKGMAADESLALGVCGWLLLRFYRGERGGGAQTIKINCHHGFVGGRLAGAKALNMQRWLWTHSADLVIFGHSHNTSAQPEAVEGLNQAGDLVTEVRKGCFSGTFLRTTENGATTYSEAAGYFPLPICGARITLRPGAARQAERVKIEV